MMDKDNTTPSRPSNAKGSADRRVKFIFFAVVIVAATAVYFSQRRGPTLPDWGDNLDIALKKGRQEDRPVLVLFLRDPPSETLRKIQENVLKKPESTKAIKEGKFIRVKIKLRESFDSRLAKTHRIKKLPTMLILGSDGKELNRRAGYIAFADFWGGFLNYSRIETADSP